MSSPNPIKKPRLLTTSVMSKRKWMKKDFAKMPDRIPEEEFWKRFDHFVSRSGGGRDIKDGGEFRVYSKGIVSLERVGIKDDLAVITGLGVAIFDDKDNLIQEIAEVLVDDAVATVDAVSEIGASVIALIRGLSAASSLKLERVKFFCYSDAVFDLFCRHCPGKEEKATDLGRQIRELHGKFTHCQPIKVARDALNPAFKLAREAIFSEVVRVSGGKEKCFACDRVTNSKNFFGGYECIHRFCKVCITKHVKEMLLKGNVPVCPIIKCRSNASVESCKKFLSSQRTEMLKERIKEASVPVKERVYCPYPECSELMSTRHVNTLKVLSRCEISRHPKHAIISFAHGRISGARKCRKCHRQFCINCKVPWHYKKTCDEYKAENPPSQEDLAFMELAVSQDWRQCVKCNHMIDHGIDWEGCLDVTCRCGFRFCFRCGDKWTRDSKGFYEYHVDGFCGSTSYALKDFTDDEQDEEEEEN